MKVGFVAIIGEPNVGKSTLLNHLVNFDVAITSPMIQTTRNQIKGIYNSDEAQIIFIDTPGIHKAQHKLGQALNSVAFRALKDVELILLLVPINVPWTNFDNIINKIDLNKTILIMTKIDLVKDQKTLDQRAEEFKSIGFKTISAVSNKINESLQVLKDLIIEKLPIGHRFYDVDDVTDVSLRFMTKEIIRESIISYVFQEVPHSLAVIIDEFIENDNDKNQQVKIKATIFVERDSQKGILIGKHGQTIKKIGIDARKKIIQLLDQPVHLDLSVKVSKNWTRDEKQIKKMGY